MNNVTLIGRLTKTPEIRYSGETAFARFPLAVDRPYSKEGEKGVDFINIVVFGKKAENCERFLDKGRQVGIQGRIQTGSYKTQAGETRYTTEVIADRVEFLGTQNKAQPQSTPDEDIPQGFSYVSEDIPF